ncbi:phosphatidate cytidylyltransferase [Piscinibacter aquaticus]|uniref:Phosphatidate cytidylyltransferase n=1 Tax=Piscinibacter aquaticus TaxID=392597 RepID=A0A5C6U0M8_9BURK|nr:phosphatidate cytidylyltransferase [Piscinibacter aquaticus]
MGSLRDLSVDQQVALLFVLLFGLLAIVSIVATTRSVRERTPADQELFDRFVRDLRAVWAGAVLFWVAWIAGAVVSTLLFGVLSFVALREFVTLTHTRRGDHRSLLLAFFVVLPVQYVIVATRHFDLFTVFIPVYVFLAIPVISAFGNDPTRFLERTAKIQWGVMVCVYGMSHAPALLLLDLPRYADRGAFMVLYLVVVVATAQIAQEAASRWLRRRPVARAISRSFSWRARWAGALAAAIVGAALYWATPFKPVPALVMGFIAGGSGTFGEFVMKALKKDAGVRSWGGKVSVTGAVGLLDRVAPLCFAAPVFFHAVRWYFSLRA